MAAVNKSISASDKIQQSLLELLMEKPYKSISVSELSAKAGVSRQAFYLHYGDKEEVLEQLLLRLFNDIMAAVQAEKTGSVESLVRVYTDVVEKHALRLKLLADNDLGSYLSRVFIQELIDREPVLNIQKQPNSSAERLYINSFWVSAFTVVYTEWLKDGMKTPKEHLNTILCDIMTGVYFK